MHLIIPLTVFLTGQPTRTYSVRSKDLAHGTRREHHP